MNQRYSSQLLSLSNMERDYSTLLHNNLSFLLDAIKKHTILGVGFKALSLQDVCGQFACKFFFQAQQQGYEQDKVPLFPDVVVCLMPSSNPWLTFLGLGSYPGEDMDVCKCIVPSRHGGTINSRQAASPLVGLVEGEERWEAPDHPQVSSLKIGVETSQIVLSLDGVQSYGQRQASLSPLP
ncbi:uncharacterized protein TNCV_2394871 [Trichonephila clavipes]|nr:uncharacterized protein TNCV_2394871 [Trichonephila clavipes]